MVLARWNTFVQTLPAQSVSGRPDLAGEVERFREFVRQTPDPERIPLLLHAYDRYRELGSICGTDPAQRFESSCYSILISTILESKIRPTQEEAAVILRRSYHQCGHGSDVEPPLALAERAFRNHSYSDALFDAVAAYYETLRPTRSTTASNVKRKLKWVLWHDARRIEKSCCTRHMQNAIHAMPSPQPFAWQWLLRNTAPGLNSSPGKGWIKEGKKRLSPIGEEEFLRGLDQWFNFPDAKTTLSPAGSAMLRLLVWYASLVDVNRSLPILVRFTRVSWVKRNPALKVVAALAWLLRQDGGSAFQENIDSICREWSGESAEVNRLQEAYFPADAEARRQADQERSAQRRRELDISRETLLEALKSVPSGSGTINLRSLISNFRPAEPSK
jgi:hypothetical protein